MRRCMILTVATVLLGCGDGLERYPTAKTTGKVMCNGEPVPFVRILFAPTEMKNKIDSGKPAEGFAGADGTFSLSTYGKEDGAVVGKHEVRVDRPPLESFPDFKCDCGIDAKTKVTEIEVKSSGENNFTINLLSKEELAKQRSPGRKGMSKDELQDLMDSDAASQGQD